MATDLGAPYELPEGLCGNRTDHEPHSVVGSSLSPFWCTADQSARLPWSLERQRKEVKTDGSAADA